MLSKCVLCNCYLYSNQDAIDDCVCKKCFLRWPLLADDAI